MEGTAEQASVPAPSWTARAADRSWALIRRIHLGTRKPDNWAQLFKFGLVGATGYLINLAVFALLTQAGDVHHIAAAVAAFCVAVSNNFIWNRQWTFRAHEGHPGFQAARFFAVSIVAFVVAASILELLVSVAGVSEVLAQAISLAVSTPLNFVGNKVWSFAIEVSRD